MVNKSSQCGTVLVWIGDRVGQGGGGKCCSHNGWRCSQWAVAVTRVVWASVDDAKFATAIHSLN